MSFKEGVKLSLSLLMPKTRNWRITESSNDTIRNVAKAFTHIRRWKRAERLKVRHCSPDVGAPQTAVQHMGAVHCVPGCCNGLSGQVCKYVTLRKKKNLLSWHPLPSTMWIKEPLRGSETLILDSAPAVFGLKKPE